MDNRFLIIKEHPYVEKRLTFFRKYNTIAEFNYVYIIGSSNMAHNAFMISNLKELREIFFVLMKDRELNKHWTKIYILFKKHIYTISLLKEYNDSTTLFLSEWFYFDIRDCIFTNSDHFRQKLALENEVNDENKYEVFDKIIREIKKNLF